MTEPGTAEMFGINNFPKFILLLVAIVGVIVLMALRVVSADAGMFFLGTATGVGIGNGIASKRGETVEPIFGSQNRQES